MKTTRVGERNKRIQVYKTAKVSDGLFPMAIAYDMKGDWRKAEKLLEEAAARGCNRAKAFKAVRVNE